VVLQAMARAGIVLQAKPAVYLAALPGRWLLDHSSPSWRIHDPKKGFQRVVKEERAREIAKTVLDKGRTFPNAITLATDAESFELSGGLLKLPGRARFLVVDGQHRLWAQRYSEHEGLYPCVIHAHRTEKQMAELFLEINDNQRRVPSSLRWDLVRLVRSEDESTAMTADVVYELATRAESPFFATGTSSIDLTGERDKEPQSLSIKQGSLAPEIRTLIRRNIKKHARTVDAYTDLLVRCFTALKSIDGAAWATPESQFFKARVLRAVIRVLSDVVMSSPHLESLTTTKLRVMFSNIDPETLSGEAVRKIQGSAGVQDLYEELRKQVIGTGSRR
jgi:DGQHR domain-containing protein